MHRIDTPTAQKDKFGTGKNGYTDGNPQTGVPATDLTSSMFDALQEEICGVIESQGMTLDKSDNGQLLAAIESLLNARSVPAVDDLYITRGSTDPNIKWPGTTWVYLGEGLTLRTAKADGSDAGSTVGADSVTLTAEQTPVHSHSIGGSTGSSTATSATSSSFDYGSKGTDSQGAHTHTIQLTGSDDSGSNAITQTAPAGVSGSIATSSAGAHTHTTAIGAHTHTVTVPAHSHTLPAATGNAGGAADGATTPVSIIPKSILVMVWVRTA